jgi:hypothetical protein
MPHDLGDSGVSTALDCFHACSSCVSHCLERGGDHASPDHIALLLDCADACVSMVASMSRRSPIHGIVARMCAEACRRCAEACEQFPDDEVMRSCAELCRRCADECDRMAAVAA